MALRGKKPKDERPRLKLLMDGEAGVGKTTALCQMPRPYIIDTEDGSRHYGDMIEKAGGAVFQTTELGDAVDEIKELARGEHEFLTLALDPFTVLWDTEVEQHEQDIEARGSSGYFDSGYQRAKRPAKRLMNLVAGLDMNVVFTCHTKARWKEVKRNGKTQLVQDGTTFDGYKKLDYLFDLWVTLRREGKDRVAMVRKTRIDAFPDQTEFPWSYGALVERYGGEKLERKIVAVEFATEDQVLDIVQLVAELDGDGRSTFDKKLKAYEDYSDIPEDKAAKVITWLKERTAKPTAALDV